MPAEEELFKQIEVFPHHRIVDARSLAKKAGNFRAANIVMIGAIADLLPFEDELVKKVISDLFQKKGERIVQMNLDAFELGKKTVATLQDYIFRYVINTNLSYKFSKISQK